MKMQTVLLATAGILVAVVAYSIGRFQGKEREPRDESVSRSTASHPSLLGQGTGSRIPRIDDVEIDPEMGGRDLIDALIASRKAVSPDHISLAIFKAAEESDPVRSNLMFAQLLQMLTPENARAALEALAELPRSGSITTQLGLFRYAWGQLDGPSAANHVAIELGGRNARYAAHSVMSGWASVEPNAAIGWVETVEAENEREYFYRGVISGLAKIDPGLATSFALERHAAGDKEADDYISTIAREQMRNGIEVATEWIDTINVDELKRDAVYRVAREMVRREPAEAAEWVEAYVGNAFAVSAVGEVADEWAEEDGAAAAAWAATLPPGDARNRAFGQAFNEWTEDDPFAAAEFLVKLPNGPDRDAGVQALARRHVGDDPEAAVTWADSITDAALRESTLTYTGQQWMRREPEKAKAWLETSGLSDEIRQKIETAGRNAVVYEFRAGEGGTGFSSGAILLEGTTGGGTIRVQGGGGEIRDGGSGGIRDGRVIIEGVR